MERSVLVTGAGTGIGLATSLLLAERGFLVYGTVLSSEQSEELARAAAERGVPVQPLLVDVTRQETIDRGVQRVVEETGGIWGVVNNAGLGLRGFFEDLSEEEIRATFDVNVFGVMAVTRAVLPHMRRAGRGRVVLMSSAGGRLAAMTLSGYCAGKFAIEGLGESLFLEMAPFGVDVSIVEPGIVRTPHFTVHRGQARAAVDPASPYRTWFLRHERLVDEILATHRITADDVARTVLRALSSRRPRLRYVVGWRPKLLVALRDHLPAAWFDRLYLQQSVRRVARPHPEVDGPGTVAPPTTAIPSGERGGDV
jgi:NAD(P)-dependent dehydrogenase (short-subunit alcohol dehydrogenase family)